MFEGEKNRKSKILIADDNPLNLKMLTELLNPDLYKISIANNGRKVLENAPKVMPDLILLDIMMPEMDGFEVCAKLKQDEKTRDIPVIFLTAKVSPEDIVKGFEIGASDYVTKPFNSAELMARVKTHIELKKSREAQNVLIKELRESIENIKTLKGLIPICASCKKIRDDSGYWSQVEDYLQVHSDASFSHGICPDCMKKLYPDLIDKMEKNNISE